MLSVIHSNGTIVDCRYQMMRRGHLAQAEVLKLRSYWSQVIKLILEGILLKTPESSPPLIRHLLHDCWKLQPADRITFGCIHSQLLAERRQPRRSAYSQKKNFKTGSSYITVSDVIEVLETDEDTKSTSQVCVLKE